MLHLYNFCNYKDLQADTTGRAMVEHAFNSSTQEAEAGESL